MNGIISAIAFVLGIVLFYATFWLYDFLMYFWAMNDVPWWVLPSVILTYVLGLFSVVLMISPLALASHNEGRSI